MSKSKKRKSSANQRPKGTTGRPPAPSESRASREARRTARQSSLADRLRAKPWLVAAAVVGAALIIAAVFLLFRSRGAASPAAIPTVTPATAAVTPAAQTTPAPTGSTRQYDGPPAMAIDTQKTYVATFDTAKGQIVAELYPADAPQTVNNFVFLARDAFYNGLTFHRVEPDFVVQGGDPAGNGTGGPGYTIPAEIKRKHTDGALAMARRSDDVNPERESSGSQFYITLGAQPNLDDQYTVFGQVVEGMDIARTIAVGDAINSISISEK